MSNYGKKDLKSFVRVDASGRVVAGSLVLRRSKPKNGKWKEIETYPTSDPTGGPVVKAFIMADVGVIDHATACASTAAISTHYFRGPDQIPTVGSVVYTDALGEVPVNSDGLFFHTSDVAAVGYSLEITGSVVTLITACA
jgi:hypothetical protein